jgi:membrane protease YdiL (CAAX protease family)
MEAEYNLPCRQLPPAFPIVLPLVLILLGEILLFMGNFEGSVLVHLVNIAFCFVVPIFFRSEQSIWQAFSLISTLRVLNLSMPRFDPITLHWIPLIYAPIIILGFLAIRNKNSGWMDYVKKIKSSVSNVHSSKIINYYTFGIAIAFLLAILEFVILNTTIPELEIVPDLNIDNIALSFVILFLFVSLGEELVFRKILQDRLETILNPFSAILIASTAFAFMYLSYESIFFALHMFSVGLMLGIFYHRTKSLILIVIIHGSLDFFLFVLFPLIL